MNNTDFELASTSQPAEACAKPPAVSRYGERGPWLVALHSSMSSRRQWQRLGEALSDEYRALTIDLLGYGDAPAAQASGDFSLDIESARIRRIIHAWIKPSETLHLVGHSYGGAVSLRLALELADRVDSVTLYEPTSFHLLPGHHPGLRAPQDIAAIVTQLSREPDEVEARLIAAELFVDFWSGPGTFSALEEVRQLRLSAQIPKVALDFMALFSPSFAPQALSQLDLPVSLIAGRDSPDCVHQIIAVLAELLPRRQLRWMPAGHMGPITHPELMIPMVRAFLRGVHAEKASHSASLMSPA